MSDKSTHSITASPPFQGADGRWYAAVPVLGPRGERRIGYLSARTRRAAIARLAAWRPLPGEPRLELGRLAEPGRRRGRLGLAVLALVACVVVGSEVIVGQQASATSSAPPPPPKPTNPLTQSGITRFLAGRHVNVTMALYDRVTGKTWLYRPKVTQTTASIMKVDILAAALRDSQEDDTPLTAEDTDAATTMIENSDDHAADVLWQATDDGQAVGAFNKMVGTTKTSLNTQLHWGLSTTSALDQVKILKTVAYPGPILTPQSQGFEVGLMTNVEADQRWGVAFGVPAGVQVAIKNGWDPLSDDSNAWQVNSIGWIKGAGRDYVLAVLTVGSPSEQDGIDTIQGVAPQVWNALAPASAASAK